MFFILCGCEVKTTFSPILDNISFNADMLYGKHSYSAEVTIENDNIFLTVIEPSEIKDLILHLNNDTFFVQYKDTTYSREIKDISTNEITSVLYNVFKDAKTKSFVNRQENCTIKGVIIGYDYLFIFSPTGLPVELNIQQLNLNIKFNNVTLI